MSIPAWLNVTVFISLQIVAALWMKWGGTAPDRYWWGFVLANAFGIGSLLFIINLYKIWPAGLVVAVTTGGSFVLIQLALCLVFRERLSFGAWCGILLIFAGIVLVGLCRHTPEPADGGKRPIGRRALLRGAWPS